MTTSALFIAVLLAVAPSPLPQAASGIIEQQLAEADRKAVGQADVTGIEGFGELDEGDHDMITLNLRQGVEYYVVGVCDQGCSDLDMTAFDSSGVTLDDDVAEDDVPVLAFTPDHTGRVTLIVDMATCGGETCKYGYRVYQSK